jgi:hypothetical protein
MQTMVGMLHTFKKFGFHQISSIMDTIHGQGNVSATKNDKRRMD